MARELHPPDFPTWGIGPIAPSGFIDHGDGTASHGLTRRMWQIDGGASGPRSWRSGQDYCEDLDLGGHNDWRLPSPAELLSIRAFSFESSEPFVAPLLGLAPQLWASWWTARAADEGQRTAWAVEAGWYATAPRPVAQAAWARCVRLSEPSDLVVAHGLQSLGADGLLDPSSGLAWQRCSTTKAMEFQVAAAWCAQLPRSTSGVAWRIPNIRELESIADRSRPVAPGWADPGSNPTAGPGVGAMLWSSTPVDPADDQPCPAAAYVVRQSLGVVQLTCGCGPATAACYVGLARVRCVQ